jgi:hypothetical protein
MTALQRCWIAISRFLRCVWGVLAAEKMPVWLTLLTLVCTGIITTYATYKLAPKLNSKFEAEKIRSAYVIDNLKNLNKDTAEFLALVGGINRDLLSDNTPNSETVNLIKKYITVFQWKAIEYDIIFTEEASKRQVRAYVMAIEKLRVALESIAAVAPIDAAENVLKASREFSRETYRIIQLLSRKAEIEVHIEPF